MTEQTVNQSTDLTALLLALNGLPDKLRYEALEIIRVNAELICGYAQVLAPVDTGNLRDSIHVTSTLEGSTVSTESPYAVYVEAKTPFLEPAYQLVLPQLMEQLTSKLQEIINHEC